MMGKCRSCYPHHRYYLLRMIVVVLLFHSVTSSNRANKNESGSKNRHQLLQQILSSKPGGKKTEDRHLLNSGSKSSWKGTFNNNTSYTIDLLPQPSFVSTRAIVEVQILPWFLMEDSTGSPSCLNRTLVKKAIHDALKKHPPPAGVSLSVRLPPPDLRCSWMDSVEYLLSQMMSPEPCIIIGGVEPSLCRVASHLAQKSGKMLLSWSCLEIPESYGTSHSIPPSEETTNPPLEGKAETVTNKITTKRSTESKNTVNIRNNNTHRKRNHVISKHSKTNKSAFERKNLSVSRIRRLSKRTLGGHRLYQSNVLMNNKNMDDFMKLSNRMLQSGQNFSRSSAGQHVLAVTPVAGQVARATRAVLQHFRWKFIRIITVDSSYWSGLSQAIDVELRQHRHSVSSISVISDTSVPDGINRILSTLENSTKALLLIMSSTDPVLLSLLQKASSMGVLKNRAVIVIDPFTEAVPSNDQERDSQSGKFYKAINALSRLEESIQRSVMVLSPVAECLKSKLDALCEANDQRKSNNGDLNPKHKNRTQREASKNPKTKSSKSEGKEKELPSTSTEELSDSINHADIVRRLVFDSISLSSHVLRVNVGTFKFIRSNKNSPNASSSKTVPPTNTINKDVPSSESSFSASKFFPRKVSSNLTSSAESHTRLTNREKKSVPPSKMPNHPSLSFLSQNSAERYRLYFELKQPQTNAKHRQIEERLETLITEQLEANKVHFNNSNNRSHFLSAGNTSLLHSTHFGTLSGRNATVFYTGIRKFDFLLLDWRASGLMRSVLRVIDTTFAPPEVLNAQRENLVVPSKPQGKGSKSSQDSQKNVTASFKSGETNRPNVSTQQPNENHVSKEKKESIDSTTEATADEDSSTLLLDILVVTESPVDWAFDTVVIRDEECYFTLNGCEEDFLFVTGLTSSLLFLIVIVTILTAIGVSLVIAMTYRKWKRQRALSMGPNKILLTATDVSLTTKNDEELKKVSKKPDILAGSFGSPRSGLKHPRHNSLAELGHNTLCPSSSQGSEEVKAKYKGDFVHVRYFVTQGSVEIKSKTMALLKQMHDLRNENINVFVGILCDPLRSGFVFDYASRGSLEDVIQQDDIKLDWFFKLSLLTDLVKGMRYLHTSPIRHHGRLSSRNCVIDSRWVLKVTDYALTSVYEIQNIPQPIRNTKDLLWKAPELLRDDTLLQKGSNHGDVFSFGIIMQEVFLRGEPYCMIHMSHDEILCRLRDPPPMIRPSVRQNAAPPDAINLMKQCWAEQPERRPDFNEIHEIFKKLHMGRRQNIVDTMFQMLEKYSSNLEDLIKERTELLDVEKKKTEQLLNRMLPSSVADQLKLGMQVAPEEFDEVTIYFSDIVGFTTISAYSTPFEVVDLLNDLYTAFDATIDHYNVYKIETIGDAYMVVGGVPHPTADHAQQIAQMALDLLHLSGKFRIRHLQNIPLMLRIGIHTGPCCAGVVGVTMPRYCLFGDTVNTASRMESCGSAWRIHISEQTAIKLRKAGDYHIKYRGRTQLKGKGFLPTYWLLGKKNFDKALPTPPEIGLDEELMKQGRQYYTSRRDSVVEVMSTAKLLSQNAALSGVSGISLSRANSLIRHQTEYKGSHLQVSDSQKFLSRLTSVQHSPDGGSPEVTRKQSHLTETGSESQCEIINSDDGSSVKGVEDKYDGIVLNKNDCTFEGSKAVIEAEVSKTSVISQKKLNLTHSLLTSSPNISIVQSIRLERVNEVNDVIETSETIVSDSTCKKEEKVEEVKVAEVPEPSVEDIKARRKSTGSNSSKIRQHASLDDHDYVNIDIDSNRKHKTSSSSDLSRKSIDKSTNTQSKVCKPGLGCRFHRKTSAAQSVRKNPLVNSIQPLVQNPPHQYINSLVFDGSYLNNNLVATLDPRSPYYMSALCTKTLPKTKILTNGSKYFGYTQFYPLETSSTLATHGRCAAHSSQPNIIIKEKPCPASGESQPKMKSKKVSYSTKPDKKISPCSSNHKKQSHINFKSNLPADIKPLSESTML